MLLPQRLIPRETTVAVLMGGWSAERKVSISSGEACFAALKRAGFNAVMIDVTRERIHSQLMDLKPHVAFNALHGKWGEDGCCSAMLETLRIPYTHSGVLASALAMNKHKSKIVFKETGIPTPESRIVPLEVAATSHPLAVPYVVKPIAEGSSIGVHIVDRTSNGPVAAIAEQADIFGTHALVERFIPGRELTCAVMGGIALGVIDVIPQVGFYDYEAKYSPGGSQHILPAEVPKEIYRKCQMYSLMAHDAIGCRGISRCDFRYEEMQGQEGQLYLIEINTQPGMTGTSLVPEMAAHAGHTMEELVTWMVNDASLDR
jgi:D-alanine-D-alanine ligase